MHCRNECHFKNADGFMSSVQVVKGLEVPTFVVYIASFIFFGAGLAGITYGIFSASWDPRREGSLTGLDEFKENLPSFTDKKKGR